ncbi:MAG: nucleotide exchange factor GrpE [Bacteroidales bacterium]|nr:nucleotide exchange factor GrpE [Bacteroidales bacterium]
MEQNINEQNPELNNEETQQVNEPTQKDESTEKVESDKVEDAMDEAKAENAEAKSDAPADPLAELQAQLDAQRDQYLRLMADFDNYRKNQLKKTNDLLTYGGEEAFKKLLPIIDDFERAVEHNEKAEDIEALREGFKLIYGKLKTYLEQSGVSVIAASAGDTFDETQHEAITMFPAPAPELKGKIVDCATKGYKYKDKVIRIAKVVVGE